MKYIHVCYTIFIMLFFTACTKNTTTENKKAYIRVIHGMPNAGKLNISYNNTIVGSIDNYGISSAYTELSAGTGNLQVTAAAGTTSFVNATITIANQGYYTVVLADSTNKVKVTYLTDNVLPDTGKAKLCIYHLNTANSNTSSVNFVRAGTTPITLFTTRSFNDQMNIPSNGSFINIDAGNFIVQARQVGTASGAMGLITATNSIQYDAGSSYTLILRNPVSPSTVPSFSFAKSK